MEQQVLPDHKAQRVLMAPKASKESLVQLGRKDCKVFKEQQVLMGRKAHKESKDQLVPKVPRVYKV